MSVTADPGFWFDDIDRGPRRDERPLPREVDVAIVGGGYTGLWTAFYLAEADPGLKIAILEAGRVGDGASGRNGGWVTGFFSGPRAAFVGPRGREGVIAMQREMFRTVDEVGRVAVAEAIDAGFVKGGNLSACFGRAQMTRAREGVTSERDWGLGEADLRLLDAAEFAERLRPAGALGGTFTPHTARVDPAKLVVGLAAAVTRRGVEIHERTPVLSIWPHRAETSRGPVAARWVVRATEGYTASLAGMRRDLVPMNSSMIVTDPLPAAFWREVGWGERETVHDGAHVYIYMQRTADDRIAIGGRGRPYRFGSDTSHVGEIRPRTAGILRAKLESMFPGSAPLKVARGWSGVLGVPRDWCPSVSVDRGTGMARAGGYVGQGVAMSNLAGRTLADLICRRATPLVDLPWVDRQPPRWEPEPARYASIKAVYALYGLADSIEARSGRPSRLAQLVDRLSGRH